MKTKQLTQKRTRSNQSKASQPQKTTPPHPENQMLSESGFRLSVFDLSLRMSGRLAHLALICDDSTLLREGHRHAARVHLFRKQ